LAYINGTATHATLLVIDIPHGCKRDDIARSERGRAGYHSPLPSKRSRAIHEQNDMDLHRRGSNATTKKSEAMKLSKHDGSKGYLHDETNAVANIMRPSPDLTRLTYQRGAVGAS
jgi:hypothetical protein